MMIHWAERVAFTGSPAPAIGARWQPAFTVGMRVLEDKDDLGRLLTLLRDDPCGHGPKWPVLRPCHFHSCPCRSLNAKLNDQLSSVVRHDLKIEEFQRKFCTMPCHMLQEDDLSKTSFAKRRRTSTHRSISKCFAIKVGAIRSFLDWSIFRALCPSRDAMSEAKNAFPYFP